MPDSFLAPLAELWGDVRHAARSLARQPTFVVVALLTIALGTAATTTILSVWNALVVRPVPAADPEALFWLDESRGGAVSQPLGVDALPYVRFEAYREALAGELGLAADRYRFPGGFSLLTDQGAVSAHGYLVSTNYFDVLGLVPAAGRFFSEPVEAEAVLGFDFWRRSFGGDTAVAGRTLQIDSRTYRVAGVAPEGFQGTTHGLTSDVWIPMEAHAESMLGGFDMWVSIFGRLRPGVTRERAQAAVTAAALAIPPNEPQTRVRGADLAPLTGLPPGAPGVLSAFLGLLVAAGVLVLVIAAANIVGMLLARGVARRREVSVRLALGAGRWRVARQSLIEALVLFVVGGLTGVALGGVGARLLERVRIPVGFETAFDLSADPLVLGLGLGLTAAVGALFGLVPSLGAARGDILSGLRLATHGAPEGWGWRSFVRAQVALSVVLLVTAGLFVRSLREAAAIDLGFDVDGIVVAQVDLSAHGYDEERGRAFYRDLMERVRAVPGVTAASLSSSVLLGATYGLDRNDMRPRDEGAPEDLRVNSAYTIVEPQHFETLGVELVAGRGFTSADLPGPLSAAIVSETLASRLWPGESPLGRTLSGGGLFEVVGVVRDVKSQYVAEPPTPFLFRAYTQTYRSRMTVHVRSARPAAQMLQELRGIVGGLDPNLALQGGQPLSAVVGITLFPQRFAAMLVGVYGLIGVLFAAIGVFGILHFRVVQRTRELGIRVALGAPAGRVQGELVGYGMRLTALAVTVGLMGAALASPVVSGLVIGISPLDPFTFVGVAAVLMAVAAVASWIPARRATRVDPVVALRAE